MTQSSSRGVGSRTGSGVAAEGGSGAGPGVAVGGEAVGLDPEWQGEGMGLDVGLRSLPSIIRDGIFLVHEYL